MRLISVYLNSPSGERQELLVKKVALNTFALANHPPQQALEGKTLAFDCDKLPAQAINLDSTSDSFSCFGASEHLALSGLTIRGSTFIARNIEQLQAGLDQLCGRLLDNLEY